jgi:hypothetical protein
MEPNYESPPSLPPSQNFPWKWLLIAIFGSLALLCLVIFILWRLQLITVISNVSSGKG